MSPTKENKEKNYKFSLIIPTYNRPEYLRRILSYYNEYGKDYNIIIADSSSDENKKLNGKIISSFSNLSILYLSDYSFKINQYHKLADAVNYAKGKYCIQTGDDDFITPNGINQSIDFLEKNLDFTVAHGYYISFYLKTDKKGKQQFCWAPIYSRKSNTFQDPKSRLTEHLSNYSLPTLYAVHRMDFLRMIFKETLKFTDDVRFGELLPSMLALIYGKMKCLDVLYAARENTPSSLGETSENLNDFIKVGTYDAKYERFKKCLAGTLCYQAGLSYCESEKLVDRAMDRYLQKSYGLSMNPLRFKLMVKKSVIGEVINSTGLLSAYRTLKSKLKHVSRRSVVPSGISYEDPSHQCYPEFSRIREAIINSGV